MIFNVFCERTKLTCANERCAKGCVKMRAQREREEFNRKAREDWVRLTKGDWPEEEHEQRFHALVRLVATAPRTIKTTKGRYKVGK